MSNVRVKEVFAVTRSEEFDSLHRTTPYEHVLTSESIQETIRVGQTIASSDVRVLHTSVPDVTSRIDVNTRKP